MLKYSVHTFRQEGLEAKWTKVNNGAPIIKARNPEAKTKHQRENWWLIDKDAWKTIKEKGIVKGFDSVTLLGNVFSLNG